MRRLFSARLFSARPCLRSIFNNFQVAGGVHTAVISFRLPLSVYTLQAGLGRSESNEGGILSVSKVLLTENWNLSGTISRTRRLAFYTAVCDTAQLRSLDDAGEMAW